MKICLDPGHYGSNYNPGVAAGYVESNFTWDYFLLLKERLEQFGVEVIGTRATKEEDMGLQARGRCSEGCDLFISIHSDGSEKEATNCVVGLYSVRSGGKAIAEKIAYAITDLFKAEWGSVMDPAVYTLESKNNPGYDYYGVLKGAASVGTPAIIIEHSFHTNKRYCEWAMTKGNLEKMADAEAQAIADYYGLTKTSNSVYSITLEKTLKKGDKGEDVKKLQMRMRQVDSSFDEEVAAHSFKSDGTPDGSFGGKMVTTMVRFQNLMGLTETGALDEDTMTALNCTIIEWKNFLDNKSKELFEEQKKASVLELDNKAQKTKINDAIDVLNS